jgi:sialic acid synthase SpsE/spore coat polysaccharide biosynthesis protein SpsF (cytidylyltransferase family)
MYFSNFREPYVIAEIGVNHEGNFELAKRLIDLAKSGGAHAAKFQSYKAEKIAAKESPSYWDLTKESTTSQYQLFKKYDSFGSKEYIALAEYCGKVGIDFLSTPFDLEAVEFLNPLMKFFKIASADITNIPLLKAVASKKKPVVLSTGASRLGEISKAVEILKGAGASEVILLHCVLNYPTPDVNAHISMIDDLKNKFPELVIGYSDHTVPDEHMTALTMAWHKGARVIEKHFTHDKSLPGNDHYHAMTAEDLRIFLNQVTKLNALGGTNQKQALPSERLSRRNARRSLVTLGPVLAGEILTTANTIAKRPATGISPIYLEEVLGRKIGRDLPDDHILQWTDLAPSLAKKNIVGIVQARMGSQRFPGKMTAKLGNKTLIEWVLGRIQKSTGLTRLCLATSTNPMNDEIAQIAEQMGIVVFRGEEDDVLNRFYSAAQTLEADAVVRICGDNPFIDAKKIDSLISFFLDQRPDYAFNHLSRGSFQYADGFGAEIFSKDILEECWKYASSSQREHVTQYIWDHAQEYDIRAPEDIQLSLNHDLRFDVDEMRDLKALSGLLSEIDFDSSSEKIIIAARSTGYVHPSKTPLAEA